MVAIKVAAAAQARSRGAKPPPRNGTSVTCGLAFGCGGVVADHVPEPLFQGNEVGVGGRAPGQRVVDADRFADFTGAARQNNDLVAEADRLGKIVG
jgi:hypothetical protein